MTLGDTQGPGAIRCAQTACDSRHERFERCPAHLAVIGHRYGLVHQFDRLAGTGDLRGWQHRARRSAWVATTDGLRQRERTGRATPATGIDV